MQILIPLSRPSLPEAGGSQSYLNIPTFIQIKKKGKLSHLFFSKIKIFLGGENIKQINSSAGFRKVL